MDRDPKMCKHFGELFAGNRTTPVTQRDHRRSGDGKRQRRRVKTR